jgi:phosphoenolpyruvate-protein phosphotransferase (PTS system enzyme I)
MVKIKGININDGIAIAKSFVLKEFELDIEIKNKDIKFNKDIELKKLDDAIIKSKKDIEELKITKIQDKKNLAIINAHLDLLSDIFLFEEIKNLINQGKSCLESIWEIFNKNIEIFSNLKDDYLRERCADLKDIRNRLIAKITGKKIFKIEEIKEEVILVCEDILPSQAALINPQYIKGVISEKGGKTSHAAIIIKNLQIPTIFGVDIIKTYLKKNLTISLDGNSGEIIIDPDENEKLNIEIKSKKWEKEQKNLIAFYQKKETITKNGKKISLNLNINEINNFFKVEKKYFFDGVGLFRSEFLFIDNQAWPTEQEQFEIYKSVLEKVDNREVTIRTLDIGGDKNLNYYKFQKEDNPFLGLRGLRFSLSKKDVFKTQLLALFRASYYGKLAIMFPMVSTVEELIEAKKITDECKKELKEKNISISNDIKIGMMVEVPSVAIKADLFSQYVDFFSIGTNDLIQYTLACDRLSETVSYLYQNFNSSVLELIKNIIDAGKRNKISVSVCGEMAANKEMTAILIGLGLENFSVNAESIPIIRKLISNIDENKAKELAIEVSNTLKIDEIQKKINNFYKN